MALAVETLRGAVEAILRAAERAVVVVRRAVAVEVPAGEAGESPTAQLAAQTVRRVSRATAACVKTCLSLWKAQRLARWWPVARRCVFGLA